MPDITPIAPTGEEKQLAAPERRRKLNFGKLAAEDEKRRLPDYFVEREDYSKVRSGEASVIVGAKGAGKSAIRVKLLDEFKEGLHFIDISPDEIGWAEIKTYGDCGVVPAQAKKTAWLTLFLIDVMEYLELGRGPVYPIDLVNDLLMKAGVLPDPRLSLQEIGVQLKFVSASFGKGQQPKGIEFSNLVRAVRDCFKILDEALQADGREIRLLIDRLDENWARGEQDNLTLEGLLHAVKELSYQTAAIRAQIFLRTDIWSRLVFHDKDKFKASMFNLHWSERELLELVANRIRTSTGLTTKDDTFVVNWAFSEYIEGVKGRAGRPPTIKYILQTIQPRPRDLIFVCDAAVNHRRDPTAKISSEDVLHALHVYSKERLDNIQNSETARTVPAMPRILRGLVGSRTTISWKSLAEKIASVGEDLVGHEREIARDLLEYEVLGLEHPQPCFYSSDPSVLDVEFRHDTSFMFHPSLRDSLQLKGNTVPFGQVTQIG